MKMIEEIRGHAQITNRRPTPRPPVLYLMQLREHQHPHSPKQRVAITADWQNGADVSHPIKIKHVKAGHCEFPVVIV
ncbi:MAG: hypothetical protein EXS35_07375 [Pedosphaera sp.]|nr:hypothetical protein [Pedosphaera sp.]